ncbi:hypothetical protein [Pseudoteredinibacter isoporae]|uniref:hypothetical protein n=1 Tax=Pseudoteredinibacter isoporae TaxID=570281 RepID=UPI003105F529
MTVPQIKSGKLYALIGRSRSGKTQKALDLIKDIPCLLIWDVEEQYSQVTHRARSLPELTKYIELCAGKKAVIGYTGSLGDFNGFCKRAFWFIRKCGEQGVKSGVVLEETADVTNPSKAPEWYGILLRRGLKYGPDIFAITQRPAESDKTSVGNASIVHLCALKLPSDRDYMMRMTGLPLDLIKGLKADQDNGKFDFVTIDDNSSTYDLGQLTFSGNKPKFTINQAQIPL